MPAGRFGKLQMMAKGWPGLRRHPWRERLTDQMLFLIFQLKVLFWPLLALIEPLKGLPKRTFLKAFGVQLGLMVLWALLGGPLSESCYGGRVAAAPGMAAALKAPAAMRSSETRLWLDTPPQSS